MAHFLRKALVFSLATGVLVSELGCEVEDESVDSVQDLGTLPGEGGAKFDDVGTFRYFFSDEAVKIVVTDELAQADSPGLSVRANLWVHDPARSLPEHLAEQVEAPYPDALVQTRAFGFYPYAQSPVSFGVQAEEEAVHMRMILQGGDGWLASFAEGRYGIDCITNDARGLHLRAVDQDGSVHEGSLLNDELKEHQPLQVMTIPVRTLDDSDPAGDGEREYIYSIGVGCDDPYPAAAPDEGPVEG